MITRRRVRAAFQLAGFLVGLALLAWCLRQAFSPENQVQLRRLADASIGQIALLHALSLVTLVLNGLMFWVTLRPTRPISCLGVCATNAIATFVAYLPFKLSVVVRLVIHTRRDRIPLFTVGAWMTAVAVVMLAALSPVALGAWARHGLDLPAIAISVAGCAIAAFVLIVGARALAGRQGLERVWRAADALRLPALSRLARRERFVQLHAALDMLASLPGTLAGVALRVTDTAVQAWRFAVAAAILGIPITMGESVVLSLVYFLVSIFTPIGMLGSREAATAAVALAMGLRDELRDTDLPLLVTATEGVVNLAGAAVALAIMRPSRLLLPNRALRRGRPRAEPVSGPPPPSPTAPAGEPPPRSRT